MKALCLQETILLQEYETVATLLYLHKCKTVLV